ncbi:hypothetical protein BDP27DRAFT_1431499 [Rhodocollybia butyracea]|uniref:Uncharacterized protein n=1 Tax=Rhodocollybia butyracea TaxID=206335 RepID=A0A9P5TY14_9AGAR|nr:hypothetical protein BDP27DRAFT_1431499 [Rhodocollybia butyracea]
MSTTFTFSINVSPTAVQLANNASLLGVIYAFLLDFNVPVDIRNMCPAYYLSYVHSLRFTTEMKDSIPGPLAIIVNPSD